MGSLPAFKFISSVILAGLLFPAGAAADAIDGTWCNGARTFHIDGQIIRTPDGVLKKGDYDRHSFKYAGSPNDYWKEKIIQMDLTDDETLRLVPGENLPPPDLEKVQAKYIKNIPQPLDIEGASA